jgi:hypothetical protein
MGGEEIIVDARLAVVLTEHGPPGSGLEDPFVELAASFT